MSANMPADTCIEIAYFIANNCVISLSADKDINHLFIFCKSEKDHVKLVRERNRIQNALNFIIGSDIFHIDWVTILVDKSPFKTCFQIQRPKQKSPMIIFPDSQEDLIKECRSYKGPCGIVRMDDHKGLFSNQRIIISSGVHPNDWLGRKMSDYWYEDELAKYLQLLEKDGELRNYSYVAKLMDLRSVKLTVDARVIVWNDQPARIVKTLATEIFAQ